MAQEIQHIGNELLQLDRLDLQLLATCKRRQPGGERRSAFSTWIARSSSRVARASSRITFFNRDRLPRMTESKLLKSCATPPVSWPMLSIFCDSCS